MTDHQSLDTGNSGSLPQPDSRKSTHIWWRRKNALICGLALVGISLSLTLRFAAGWHGFEAQVPLLVVLSLGGVPLVLGLLGNLRRGEFGSDLLAGISIVTSIVVGEYLAGSIVVLMLAGGQVLEEFAVGKASSALAALARRMPLIAHRLVDGEMTDIPLNQIQIADVLVVFPHETCPTDGTVVEGHGSMDESYLTGEPFQVSKTPGVAVLSGAINGEQILRIRVTALPIDSRYSRIMQVMQSSQQQRSRLRRLGDELGAYYTPMAVGLGVAAWIWSGDPVRFLAVLVVATPCPLLIAIPVAIIGTISRAASRGIIIKDPAVLETVATCRTAIFDKTGTLTAGEPTVVNIWSNGRFKDDQALQWAASLERYSKHPLAVALLNKAEQRGLPLCEADTVSETPGRGLRGSIAGHELWITNRNLLLNELPELAAELPPQLPGLECLIVIDRIAVLRCLFRDEPRSEGADFIHHLPSKHQFQRILLVSGDRDAEARYLAEQVGITDVYAAQTPENKLRIVQAETRQARTLYVGDGINDAPAMVAATVGIAFGQNSDVTAEAAGAVILESSLERLDEFLHLGRRMRQIALQSAVGGMLLSLGGMLVAAAGLLPPVAGAALQEGIDVVAVLNAMRAVRPGRVLSDFDKRSKPRVRPFPTRQPDGVH